MNAARALRTGLFGLLGAAGLLAPHEAFSQAGSVGQWTASQALPFAPVHNVYLPNRKVMLFSYEGGHSLWDPVTGQLDTLPGAGFDLFCSGHVLLPDGRVLVAGGHIVNDVGLPKAALYNPATNSWTPAPDMNAGRWYPTVTTLPNGDALVVSGNVDLTVGINTLPQVYEVATNSWRNLTGAQLSQEYYPMMFVAPNGRVIEVGPDLRTRSLDTSGAGHWTQLTSRTSAYRYAGTAAMYAEGKILLVGGGDPPTASAEVLDLNAATPAWRTVRPMSVARRHVNSTILPDGTVLITGGTSGPGFNDAAGAVFSAELWNPETETWTTMASGTVPRLYHSSAFLLADGRVAVTGGDNQPVPEIFSPPYLFKGARPTLGGAPARIAYGQPFSVQSPESAGIRKVTLIKLSSVTHSFNMDQRLNVLPFTAGAGTLQITPPADANLAPPGHYLLFLVDANGVPSVGSIVQLGTSAPTNPPPGGAPTVSSLSPASATAGGPAFTLAVGGSNFVSGATVLWNGSARATTFVSATQLTAAIAAADIATSGTAQISVVNPGGAASPAAGFTIAPGTTPPPTCSHPDWVQGRQYAAGAIVTYNGALYVAKFANPGYNPTISTYYWAPYQCTGTQPPPGAPAVASLAPSSAAAGGAGFTLTVNGSNFVSGAVVRWNGAARTTTFVSASQLTAAIPATDIASAGTAQVSVLHPGGAVSGNAAFTVSAPAGGTCTYPAWVQGRQYAAGAIVTYNGALYVAKFANPGYNPTISTYYWAPHQCTATEPPAASPAVASLAPNTARAGGFGFTLTVNGSNFVSGAVVRWNGAARTTTFVSASQLTAAIPTADLATAGTAQVSVLHPDGAASGNVAFTISPPPAPPAVASLAPNSAAAGGAGFALTVNGSNFISGAVVRWNGAARTTTFVSASQLTAAIPAADIATAGTAQVSVLVPGGAVSGNASFTIGEPAPPPPAVASLAPDTATAGSAGFTLTVNGSNFVSGAVVRWNGAARATTFVSASQLTASIAATDIATAGTAQVSVLQPGGAVSGGAAFTVSAPPPTCSHPDWVQGRQYAAGAIVAYNGALYVAKFANPGYNPTISTYYWAPYQCTGSPPPGAPAVSSLAPSSAIAGGAGFTLTIDGTNFAPGSVVRWNGAARTTTFVGTTQLRATIPAGDIASARSVPVTVLNPDGAVSADATFTVTADTAGCAYPAWVQGRQYAAGAIVTYQGRLYRAKFANPGYNPTISTYYWAPYTCA